MTNEEIINYGSMMPSTKAAAQCACEMKDKQFKKYLEEKSQKNVPPGVAKDDLNLYSPSYFEGRDDVIREIINELFKED